MFKIYVNWKRDQYHFLILFLLHFCAIFIFFWEEKDIKFEQNTYLSLILTKVGYGKQTEHILGG